MTKIQGPWGEDTDETPWSDAPAKAKKAKINLFPKVAESDSTPPSFNVNYKLIILGLFVLWGLSGFYQVQTNEQGVVLRFGKYIYTTEPGLRYHLPYPIENVEKVNITSERSINLGVGGQRAYNASNIKSLSNGSEDRGADLGSFTESHMLTGDENIVDINLTVVWKIKDAKDYLFSMQNPDDTVRVAAQSVLREIVGQSEMQPIITGDRGKVEDDTKEELQKLMDDFKSGINIVRVKLQKADPPKQVIDAFNEVQRAKADMERLKNEAEAYRNEILPKARGEAEQRLQDAQAYRESVVNKAKGDAERYLSVYRAYQGGREVTSKRLYLETMENVLSSSKKVVIDPSSKGANVLPLLPLNDAGR